VRAESGVRRRSMPAAQSRVSMISSADSGSGIRGLRLRTSRKAVGHEPFSATNDRQRKRETEVRKMTPGFTASASLYKTALHYYAAPGGGAFGTDVGPAQLRLPLPNGGGGCKPHFGLCNIPDPTCSTGFSRLVCGVDCECDTVCCTKPCPVTCGPCTGGSCNPYPNCGPVPGSGTQQCTDCHGNKTTRAC